MLLNQFKLTKQLFSYSQSSCLPLYDLCAQFQKFAATDVIWWRGLARIMEDKGYIREGDDKVYLKNRYSKDDKAFLC